MKTLVLAAAILPLLTGCLSRGDWRTASRVSAGMAPSPTASPEAVLQVYGASAWGWRGWFAIHTWIATKRRGAPDYTVYEVVGWRLHRGLPALRVTKDLPDRYWYGAKPRLLKEHRGDGVDALIDEVERAVHAYPWPNRYTAFPGTEQQHVHGLGGAPGAGPRTRPAILRHRQRLRRLKGTPRP